ncbi:MAG: hypothetical protein ACFFFH_04720 [Candidatus Thorarchaeota archaeon]
MDLMTSIMTILGLGLLIFLGGFLIIGILVIIYLIITGNRWD